jgi:L-methionine (R)-S-oxide reductase
MAEDLIVVQSASKEEKYKALMPQIMALLEPEIDFVANMANLSAALKQTFNFFWVGFYVNKNNDLILGPFQGPVACTRIPSGKGVCGAVMQQKETILVPDVEKFPGHIACSSLSKSEIVVPLVINGDVKLVLDVDSDKMDDFDRIDADYLVEIVNLLAKHYK